MDEVGVVVVAVVDEVAVVEAGEVAHVEDLEAEVEDAGECVADEAEAEVALVLAEAAEVDHEAVVAADK